MNRLHYCCLNYITFININWDILFEYVNEYEMSSKLALKSL